MLKERYAAGGALEVPMGAYRIDAVRGDELIEIQHGSLAAIRDKIADLVVGHRVRVVKPIVGRKQLVRQESRGGAVLGRRRSPKVGALIDIFHELVHFTRVFPHDNLVLEVALVDIEEWRYPGHGKRRLRRERDHEVEDQRLTAVRDVVRLHSPSDLWRLLPERLPGSFDTGELAIAAGVSTFLARRVAYCLRQTGAARLIGKRGNSLLYERC